MVFALGPLVMSINLLACRRNKKGEMGLQIFVHRIPIDKPKQRSRTKSYREK
jgi:hypothetical protein